MTDKKAPYKVFLIKMIFSLNQVFYDRQKSSLQSFFN